METGLGNVPSAVGFGGGGGGVRSSPNLGDTWRGLGADWFNAANIAREDFQRGELSAQNAYYRELDLLQRAQSFNAAEAQKARDHAEYLANTEYSRMIADLKRNGLNPILAFSQGGASSPITSPASVGTPSAPVGRNRNVGSSSGDTSGLIGSILKLVGAILTKDAGKITK